MKLTLLQENLNIALGNVSRFVSPKTQLPILGNILISTDSGRLKLSATNLELGINYWIGAKIEKEGSITVPSKEITEFVSYLSTGKIDLELQNNLLNIKANNTDSDFATIPAADFPTMPSANKKSIFEIDLSLLTQSVSQIAFSAATDDTRPVLTGILCQFTRDNFSLVATDGFRLSQKIIKLVNPITLPDDKDKLSFIIPSRTLVEVAKLAKNETKIKIGSCSDDHQFVFILEDLELISSLLDGEYPDYQRIIPPSFNTNIFVSTADLSQAIKMASVFSRESANVVKFNIKNNSVELSANAPQIGKNKINLDARVEGEPLEIAFNYKFISDFLSVCKGKEVLIKLNESLTPGSFQDQSDPNFIHIIMPVRIQD